MKSVKVLSLFDGISCGMVALERLGLNVDKYVAYEIDDSAVEISKTNYPQIEHMGDVFKAEYKKNEFDLLIGGSPCTYWSISRGGNNREITSSGLGWDLFSQYVRALKESEPKYFLYENNASMSPAITEAISESLGCEPMMINSADFSAQIRKRYYWTNIPFDIKNCHFDRDKIINDIIYDNTYKVRSFERYKDTMRLSNNGTLVSWDSSGKGWYSQQNRARRNCKMGTVTSCSRDKCNIYLGGTTYRNIHPVEAERLQTLPDNYTSCLKSDVKRLHAIGNGWTVNVIVELLRGLETVS